MKNLKLMTMALICALSMTSPLISYAQDEDGAGNLDWGDENKSYAWQVYAATDWQSVQESLVFDEIKSGSQAIALSDEIESKRDLVKELLLENYKESKSPKIEYVDFVLAVMQVLYNQNPNPEDPGSALLYISPGSASMDEETSIRLLINRIMDVELNSEEGGIEEIDAELESIVQGVVYGVNYTKENQSYSVDNAKAYATANGLDVGVANMGEKLKDHYQVVEVNGAINGELVHPIPDYVRMSSPYGWRIHPIYGTKKHHNGIDWAAPQGTPIYSVADGIVTFSAYSGSAGNMIKISHADGMTTTYMHNVENIVKVGDTVSAGQLIALCGTTGGSTGPHLHFEIAFDGVREDPANYF